MKKNKIWLLLLGFFCLTGCGNAKKDVIKEFTKKLEKINCYQIQGLLEVTNNEATYKYDIDVAYKKDDNYKVNLKNKTNDHEQIILKNNDGVFVLTPSLNKSFKFQSEWPYNSSQSYLYQSIVNDVKDGKTSVKKANNGHIIKTKVNYANNKELVGQNIYIDNKLNIKKIEVYDKNNIVKIKMTYNKVNNKANYNDDYFSLKSNMKIEEPKKEKKTSKINDVVYPLYLPDNTKLESEEKVKLDDGERIILTFGGDEKFTIVEETSNINDEYTTVPVYGELDFVNDTIGNITDSGIAWSSNGIDYYAMSDTLDQDKLLKVVNSVNILPVGK